MESGLAIIFASALFFGILTFLFVWYNDKKSSQR